MAQLLTSDVVKYQNRWIINFTERGGEDKSIKNKSSERIVPVHNTLVTLGFIDYVQQLTKQKDTKLFPELSRNSRGQIAATFSRSWGKFLTNLGVKTDNTVNFHSFRHTVADELRLAGFNDDQIGPLLGHAKQGMTSRYGVLNEGTIEQRSKMVDALQYRGLILPGSAKRL
jgi:integrase